MANYARAVVTLEVQYALLHAERSVGEPQGATMDDILLETSQKLALQVLVEAARSVAPEQRQPFYGHRSFGSKAELLTLQHRGLPERFGLYPGDLEQLEVEGLLRDRVSGQTHRIEVTPLGFRYYDWLKQQEGVGIERVENESRQFLDATDFAKRHPTAYSKWCEAESSLWNDGASNGTTVGHLCREAHQAFAGSLLALTLDATPPTDPAKTKARVRAAIEAARIRSETVRAASKALADYWDTVSDLAQRQEHGSKREGEQLVWEDARRLVFQTLFCMVELDRVVVAARTTPAA
jgi:hypothetical protein